MSQRTTNISYPNDLRDKVIDLFRAGEITANAIIMRLGHGKAYLLPLNFYNDKELNVEMLTAYVKDTLASFPNYDEVKDIYTNQIIIPKNENKWYLYDSDSDNVVALATEKSVRESVTGRGPVNNKVTRYYSGYSPYSRSRFFQDEGKHYFNSYSVPSWKVNWWRGVDIEKLDIMPEVYTRFFNHLFDGNTENINYVLDWMATSITSRNLCYLATIARPGIGKGVFSKILKGLHGPMNFVDKGGKSLASNFNADMEGKTLIYINEFEELNAETWEKVKRFIDDIIDIEKKGIDREFVRNHASYYFSSNHIDALQIDEYDRRFSILDMTTEKFPYDDYGDELLDQSNINKLAQYLWYRPVDKKQLAIPFLSKTTAFIKSMRHNEWQIYLDEEFFNEYSGKVISVSDLCKFLKSKNMREGLKHKTLKKYIQDSSKKAKLSNKHPNTATIFLDEATLSITTDRSKNQSRANLTDICTIL